VLREIGWRVRHCVPCEARGRRDQHAFPRVDTPSEQPRIVELDEPHGEIEAFADHVDEAIRKLCVHRHVPLKIRYPHRTLVLAEQRPRCVEFLNEAIGALRQAATPGVGVGVATKTDELFPATDSRPARRRCSRC
jgi:hypothetical protein